jgi:hypothetical protein
VQLTQLGFEFVVVEQRRIVANVFLPLMEIVDPVIKVRDFDLGRSFRFKLYSNDRSNLFITL